MSRNKKTNLICLVDIIGQAVACYQLDSYDSLASLYSNRLLAITEQGLQDYNFAHNSNTPLTEKYRFVVAANAEQFQLLLKVQPIKCYLRDKDMSAKIFQLNPYHSVGWLKTKISAQKQENITVKFIIEQKQLIQDNQCLLKYIHEDVIIHVIYIEHNNNDGACSLVLYTKQPVAGSKLFKIDNKNGQNTVQELSSEIEGLVEIPQQNLYLVYSGKILSQNKLIKQYYIQNNSIVYAVDGRKYLKKISQEQYKKKLQQSKKVKQCNKQITQMLQHALQRKQQQEKQNKQKNVKKQQEIQQSVYRNSRKPNRYKYERSGTIQADEDDTKYFKQQEQQMNIESQQFLEFDKRAKQLQEGRKLQNLQSRHREGQLQKARFVTNVSDAYQDGQGHIHQHNSQKHIYDDGYKTIDIDITQDKQGNIIKIQEDIINYKINQATGSTTKIETDIIEDNHHKKTTIIKQQTRDKDGNIIRFSTTKHTQNVNQLPQAEGQNNLIAIYQQQTSKQKLIQIDNHGIVHTHQTKVVQGQDKTTFVDNDTYEDAQGTVLAYKTEIVQIKGDQQGNVHKHKSIIVEEGNKNVVQQINQIINKDGVRVNQQKDLIEIISAEDGTLIKNQIQVVEREGNIKITQQEVTKDPTGQIVKTTKKIIQIEDGQFQITIYSRQQVQQQVQAVEDKPLNVQKQITNQLKDQQGNVISKTADLIQIQANPTNKYPIIATAQQTYIKKQQEIDQQGNLHVIQTKIIKYQGIQNVVQTQQVYDQQGHIIQKITDIKQSQQISNGQAKFTVADIVQSANLITVVQTHILVDSQGKQVRTQTDTLQIQKMERGLTRKQKQTVVSEGGVKVKVHKQEYGDNQGNILEEQVTTTQQLNQPSGENIVSQVCKRSIDQAQQDQKGHIHHHHRQVQKDQDGKSLVVESEVIQGTQNQFLTAKTDFIEQLQNEDGTISKHKVNITQKPGKVTVSQNDYIQNRQGEQLIGKVNTIAVTQGQNQQTIKKQTNVIMQQNKKIIVQKLIIQDRDGNITSQKCKAQILYIDKDGIEKKQQLQNYQIKPQNKKQQVSDQQILKQIVLNEEGNIITSQKQVYENQGQGTAIVQTQVIKNKQGQIISINTKTVEILQGQQQNIKRQQTQYLGQQKLIKTQITTITYPDGELKIQKQRGIQICQDLEVIQTSIYDIVKTDGQTTVALIQTFQDKQGNLLDSSVDVIKVRNSQQAIKEHAFKVAQAQAQGQIKGHTKYIEQDENGNKKLIQGQVIDNNGQIMTVKTVTTQSPDGQFIKSKTQITQQKIQNGQRQILQTQIIQQNGKIQVFQHATLLDRGHLAISTQIKKAEQNLDDLLGLSNQEQSSTHTTNNNQQYDFKFVDNVNNFIQVEQANKTATKTKIKNQQQNLLDGDYMQPEQLYILAVDIKRNETNLKIRYDQTVNQVIIRLKLAISKPNTQIHFYKDGKQLNQYENISDLDISCGDILYYVEDIKNQDQ